MPGLAALARRLTRDASRHSSTSTPPIASTPPISATAPATPPDTSLTEWGDFVKEFAKGTIAWDTTPLQPSRSLFSDDGETPRVERCPTPSQRDPFGTLGAELLDGNGTLAILEERGYLPAVPGQFEEERRRVLRRFKLGKMGPGYKQLDKIVDMAATIFEMPIVVVSVVLNDRETFIGTLGWDEREREEGFQRIEIPLETALCPHAMTRLEDEDACFVLESTSEDWRFKNNPYVREGGPIAFFASANIYLPTSGVAESEIPRRLPVGSICVVDKRPHAKGSFTSQDAAILKGLSEMVAREIQHLFDQEKDLVTAKQTDFLGELIHKLLVNPSQQASLDSNPNFGADLILPTIVDVASQLVQLTGADSCAILDLRSFNSPRRSPLESLPIEKHVESPPIPPCRPALRRLKTGDEAGWYSSEESRRSGGLNGRPGQGSISVLAHAGKIDWPDLTSRPGAPSAISRALVRFTDDGMCEFDDNKTTLGPLAGLFSEIPAASIALPVYDSDGKPALMMILSSFERYFRFEQSDRRLVRNLGGVVVGGLMRKRIQQADAAKLAFVSQVSHELRTPLFGIRSQLELIRMVTDTRVLKPIQPLLSVAEVCVSSLAEILEDTLEFSKLSNTPSGARSLKVDLVDLHELVADVCTACLARGEQHASVFGSPPSGQKVNNKVDLVIDFQMDAVGTHWLVDVGGLKRTLFNLIGNSLKFTPPSGTITVVVKPLATPTLEGTTMISFEICDTGRGMSAQFRKEQLFIPFRQEDSFSPGAGLGISIVDSIVKRLGGTLHFESTLGLGTKAEVRLPLMRAEVESEGGSSTRSRRPNPRVISDEIELVNDPTSLSSLELGDEDDVLAPAPAADDAAPPSPLPVHAILPDDLSLRVLIVDDNPVARRILAQFLSKKGIKFVEADNGSLAIEMFKEFRPNIVWSDVQMPGMSGIEATRAMREFEAELGLVPAYVVALSGLTSELSDHASCLESGQIDEWIVKGGPSLSLLNAGLLKQQEVLASRARQADALEALVRNIRRGIQVDPSSLVL